MNIYKRTHDLDLYKYLTDDQIKSVDKLVTFQDLPAMQSLKEQMRDMLITPLDGRLKRLNNDEKFLGYVFPGELDADAADFLDKPLPYFLRAEQDCRIMLVSRRGLSDLCETDPDLNARIQAAINDTLCLKIIRLTHLES